jgi:hypothetical protein
MIRAAVVAFVMVIGSVAAFADEATARKDFDAGERAYNLGDFNKAVELFKKAYEEWPEPAFLFNVAQTYRQSGDCKQALFFYKRFLALKQNDTKKPLKPELKREVENRIGELEECTRREIANKPPDALDNGSNNSTTQTTTTPRNTTTTTTTPTNTAANENDTDTENEEEDTGEQPTPGVFERPKTIVARLTAGAGKLTAGELETPIQFFGTIVGGYPLTLAPKFQLELGAALSFTPVPYTTTMGEHGSGGLVGVMANVSPAYELMPKMVGRLEVGVGAQVFTGLGKMGNPFTDGGMPASGPLSTFLVRVGVSGDYAVTRNVVITATPFAFAYSPAPSGFSSTISSLTTMSFMVGVGYQQ